MWSFATLVTLVARQLWQQRSRCSRRRSGVSTMCPVQTHDHRVEGCETSLLSKYDRNEELWCDFSGLCVTTGWRFASGTVDAAVAQLGGNEAQLVLVASWAAAKNVNSMLITRHPSLRLSPLSQYKRCFWEGRNCFAAELHPFDFISDFSPLRYFDLTFFLTQKSAPHFLQTSGCCSGANTSLRLSQQKQTR